MSFIRAGCSETALHNDAICSDVTRSTRALYAQIARMAVEWESSYSRPKYTLRICVIQRACAYTLHQTAFVITRILRYSRVRAPCNFTVPRPVFNGCAAKVAGKRRWFALREKRRRLAPSEKVALWSYLCIAFENIMMVYQVPFSRYYAIKWSRHDTALPQTTGLDVLRQRLLPAHPRSQQG